MECPVCRKPVEASAATCPGCGGDVRWTLRGPDGKAYGPYTLTEVQAYVGLGRISPWARLENAFGQVLIPAQTGAQASAVAPATAPRKSGANAWKWVVMGLGLLVPFVIVGIGVIASIAVPTFSRAKGYRTSGTCLQNLETISQAIRRYADENDGYYPDAATWKQDIAPYLPDGKLPECPASGLGENSYELNAAVGGMRRYDLPDPATEPLVYDAGAMGNCGGVHHGGANIAFCDGSVIWMPDGAHEVFGGGAEAEGPFGSPSG